MHPTAHLLLPTCTASHCNPENTTQSHPLRCHPRLCTPRTRECAAPLKESISTLQPRPPRYPTNAPPDAAHYLRRAPPRALSSLATQHTRLTSASSAPPLPPHAIRYLRRARSTNPRCSPAPLPSPAATCAPAAPPRPLISNNPLSHPTSPHPTSHTSHPTLPHTTPHHSPCSNCCWTCAEATPPPHRPTAAPPRCSGCWTQGCAPTWRTGCVGEGCRRGGGGGGGAACRQQGCAPTWRTG